VTLVYISIAWLAGIILGSKLHLPAALLAVSPIPLVALIFWRHHRRTVILTAVCLLTFLSAALYYSLHLPGGNASVISLYQTTDTVNLKGLVSAPLETSGKNARFRFAAREIEIDGQWQDVSGSALVYVPAYSEYRYGDLLILTGQLETPPRFDDFNYREYLSHQGVSTIIYYPRLEVMAHDQGSKMMGLIYALRNNLGQSLARALPEPQASLAQGITLGLRNNIPDDLKQDFSRTGTAHMLAISGLHLGIIAGMFMSLGLWLFGRRHYYYVWLAMGAIWFYVLITGMQAPVVRGGIMASIFLFGEMLGRQRSALTALAFAAALMVAISPEALWTVSFQMSFMAMAGLILIFPKLHALGRNVIKARLGETGKTVSAANFLADSLSVSAAAIATTWPLTAYYFGIISFTGLLANLLALPALPAIIVTGGLTSALGLIAPLAAQVSGWLAWLSSSYLIMVVSAFAALPGTAVEAGAGNALVIWGYYPLLGTVLFLSSRRAFAGKLSRLNNALKATASNISLRVSARLGRRAIPPLLLIALLTSLAAASMPDEKLHVSFLDIGQGDAILIQTPYRQDILIDGGPDPQAVIHELGKKMPFWDRTIDLVILTHPHADHLTGLIEVLKRYRVKQVLFPDLADDSPLYRSWLALVSEKGIESVIASEWQQIKLGSETKLIVLNPPAVPVGEKTPDIDDSGIVLELVMGEISFLFTADISEATEMVLASRRALPLSTVLKVAHHGSDTATSSGFLTVSRPQVAAISAGTDNRFGHPDPEVLIRLEAAVSPEHIYRTDASGTIEFITDGERLWVKTAKAP